MVEAKEKKVSANPIRAYEKTIRALKSAQHREWERTGSEPSYAELIDRAWRAYEGTAGTTAAAPENHDPDLPNLHLTAEEQELVQRFAMFLRVELDPRDEIDEELIELRSWIKTVLRGRAIRALDKRKVS